MRIPAIVALMVWLLVTPRAARAQAASPASSTIAATPDAGSEAALDAASRASDPREAAEALYALAQREDEAGRYASAVAKYRASVAALPSSRYAPRAAARAAQLEAHAEGGFAPLARLEQVRRDANLSGDAAAIDALARDADQFPPGLVRVEARMVCAEAYLHRLSRPEDGARMLLAVLDDPHADGLTRRQAARELVQVRVAAGDLDGAAAAARAIAALDPKLGAEVRALARRRALRRLAIADLVTLLALASGSIALAARRRTLAPVGAALRATSPIAILFAAYVAIAGGALASGYESGNARPFALLGGAIFPLVLVARAWGAAGSPRPLARAARGVLCATSVAAAGFLVLEAVDASYLEGFGL